MKGRGWIAPGVAASVSLTISLLTVGRTVYWQDSGFYLVAIQDLAVLYPHGFVLYELLCRCWTSALFFVDFTYAVHLFSSLCAALAAGALALAVRDLVRARSPLLRVFDDVPGFAADAAGAVAGALAASGYTFWIAGIYAKGYSFFYLVLALLLWRMVRAAEAGRPRDFTIVAALIGLAWQAHPSAVGTGLALLAFVGLHRKAVGERGLAWRTGLAAALALGPLLVLPFLVSDVSPIAFGEPRTAGDLFRYAAGSRFVEKEGAFDAGGSRWPTASRFFWEEFLGVGLALVAAGAFVLARGNRRVLAGLLLWSAPFTVMTTVFAIEGQQDHWYLAAWLPLHVLAGVGVAFLARSAGRRGGLASAAAGIAGLGWALGANFRDLDFRGYDLAERFGRLHLEPLAKDAVFISTSDDTSSTMHYLQRVRGVRPDVLIVRRGHLEEGTTGNPSWYDRRLARRDPRLKSPAYGETRARFPRASKAAVVMSSFINANAGVGRPVYIEEPPPPSMLRPDLALAPAGPLWRIRPKGDEGFEEWPLSPEPEAVRGLFRRARGQAFETTPAGTVYRAEPYERRLFVVLLRARLLTAERHFQRREMDRAAELYESILRADPETAGLPEVVQPLAAAHLHRGDAARARGAEEEARAAWGAALAVPNLDPRLRAELRIRLGHR